jgi:hypothetical protein
VTANTDHQNCQQTVESAKLSACFFVSQAHPL